MVPAHGFFGGLLEPLTKLGKTTPLMPHVPWRQPRACTLRMMLSSLVSIWSRAQSKLDVLAQTGTATLPDPQGLAFVWLRGMQLLRSDQRVSCLFIVLTLTTSLIALMYNPLLIYDDFDCYNIKGDFDCTKHQLTKSLSNVYDVFTAVTLTTFVCLNANDDFFIVLIMKTS